MDFKKTFLPFSGFVVLLTLAGCATTSAPPTPSRFDPALGRVFGGEQPITGAAVYLYAVNPSVNGGASTNLLTSTITTSDGTGVANANANAGNANNTLPAGYFTFPNMSFSCPSSATQVYFASVGGNPGSGINNAQESLSAFGNCGNLNSTSYVVLNEVTTVGTVAALQSFMTGYDHVGSTAANASSLAAAFNKASEYFSAGTGLAPGPNLPSGYDAASNDLRELANAVQTCVNSTGSTLSGLPCGKFFSAAQGTAPAAPTDTVTALLDIFADPSNVNPIYNLQSSTSPFQPTNTSPPYDWTLPILQTPSALTVSPAPGYYDAATPLMVTFTDTDTDSTAHIYYSTDGSTPTTSSTLYTGPITVSSTETINALLIDDNHLYSPELVAAYNLVTFVTPTTSLTPLSLPYGSTSPISITAYANGNFRSYYATVTFGTAGSIGGSFSPPTCVIELGNCDTYYIPSGTLLPGTYTNDLTASFAAYGSYTAASATSTLTIYRTGTDSLLASFSGGIGAAPGADPMYGSNLIQASDGNFYGMSSSGGANNDGTIFKISSTGTFTLLHNFAGGSTDGYYPEGALVQGTDGNFYGTTSYGGVYGSGTAFKVTPAGTFSLLHSFAGGTEGSYPSGGLVQGIDGNLYGTTDSSSFYGTVFQINPTTSMLTTLHTFYGGATDGSTPSAALIQGTDGNFYGTTARGGTGNYGTVFKVDSSGNFTLLHAFAGGTTDGEYPYGGLIQGADGNFYGTAEAGSSSIFSITPSGTFTLVHSLAGGLPDGLAAYAGLVLGSDGNLYGTASRAGLNNYGDVFAISPAGTESQTFSFAGGSTDGATPYGGLVQGADGNFYGMTSIGGANNYGTIYKLTTTPALGAPVALSVPASVAAGTSFSLSYAVSNAYSATLKQCLATNTGGDTTGWTGIKTGSPTTANATLTAPSAAGTYTYTLTCGGMETGIATLTVH